MRWTSGIVRLGIASIVAVAGCSNAHEAEQSDAGPIVGDSGPAQDAWAPEPCGPTTCGPGTSCCNASCGICTPPGTGCIDLACVDAGPGPRLCGGLAGIPCASNEYCDYPDGSSCGGDDAQGVCTPRPSECPDPGGNLVCGCDGTTYVGDCSAYSAGTDIAHQGSCDPPPSTIGATATSTCGPTDGPAWTFTITSDGSAVCPGPSPGATLSISVWEALESAPAGASYRIGGDFASSQGSASYCPASTGGPPCLVLFGSITIASFTASSSATITYSLTAADGTSYAASNAPVSTFCPSERFCG